MGLFEKLSGQDLGWSDMNIESSGASESAESHPFQPDGPFAIGGGISAGLASTGALSPAATDGPLEIGSGLSSSGGLGSSAGPLEIGGGISAGVASGGSASSGSTAHSIIDEVSNIWGD